MKTVNKGMTKAEMILKVMLDYYLLLYIYLFIVISFNRHRHLSDGIVSNIFVFKK